jgi:copper chaperone
MIFLIPALLVASLLGGATTPAAADTSATVPVTASSLPAVRRAALDTVRLHIEGMTCGGCTLATRKVLERLDGVAKADVSYEAKRAVVVYDAKKVTVAQMIAAVATLKYTATPETTVAAPARKS